MIQSNQSEYEPLIDSSNPFYDEIGSSSSDRSKSTFRRYSGKILLVFLSVLILSGVLIYGFLPRQPVASPLNVSGAGGSYNWLRAEASHEHKSHVPKSWVEKDVCPEDHPFTLTLALKQQNADALHEHVTAVSHPGAQHKDTFHKYWSADKVRSYFKPTDDAVKSVSDWLKENGFSQDNGKMDMVTAYGNVIRISLNCGQANKLLNTQYMLFENSKTGKQHLRVQDGIYNIPDIVHEHIDFMSPTIRFPLERHTLTVQTMTKKSVDFIKSHTKDELREYYRNDKDKGTDPRTPTDDDEDVTPNIPARLYEMYRMNDVMDDIIGDDLDAFETSKCRQSVASFIEQYYNDEDLSLFRTDLEVSPKSTMQRVPATQPQGYGSEAELDTQYITSTGKGIYTYVYYIDSDDIFVSLAEAILATDEPPLVVSISYGADEYELGEDWVIRCNQEFAKLALMGTTVLASSGDSGVRGNDEDCFEGDITSYTEPEQEYDGIDVGRGKGKASKGKKKRSDELHALSERRRRLIPGGAAPGAASRGSRKSMASSGASSSSSEWSYVASFPASATYVTAVGGTDGGTIQTDSSSSTGETTWLYSGGGFSIYFDTPDWQSDAKSSYFEKDIEFPAESRYNSQGRGYPDLAAQSVDYVIAYDSAFYLVSGTSASAPTVAGMISMINYARINAGKEALGFLNPALYALYADSQDTYFNDVTEGYNIGCESDDNIGFHAATGWDPATGLGTPKFDAIYKALLELD